MEISLDYDYDRDTLWGSRATPEVLTTTDQKMRLAMAKSGIEGRMEVGAEGTWGGKKGPEFNLRGEGNLNDRYGNGLKFKVEGNQDEGRYSGGMSKDFHFQPERPDPNTGARSLDSRERE